MGTMEYGYMSVGALVLLTVVASGLAYEWESRGVKEEEDLPVTRPGPRPRPANVLPWII